MNALLSALSRGFLRGLVTPAPKRYQVRRSRVRTATAAATPAPVAVGASAEPEPPALATAPTPVVPQEAAPAPDPRHWRKPCRARCAHTGRWCALLDGHPGGDPEVHAHGRVTFTAVAAPGQEYFAGLAELELRANARPDEVSDA